jgi:hypothetical protein
MLLPKLNRLIESEETLGSLPQVRTHVTLLALPNEPFIDWKTEHLDPAINDDRLLASILDFKHQNPAEQILLLSDDSGPRLKAKSRNIQASRPPEELKRLADPPSPEELQIRQLQKQIEALNNRPLPLNEQIKNAIETQRPNQITLIRKYMSGLASTIEALTPTFTNDNRPQWDNLFDQALDQSVESIIMFTQLCEYIAEMNAIETAHALYKGFENILNLYTFSPAKPPPGLSFNIAHDVAKFLGHELFVIFFACLMKEERWQLITSLLQGTLYARTNDFGNETPLPFHHIESHIALLVDRNSRLQSRLFSPQGDVLNRRHTEGKIAEAIPMSQFAEADYFLFLRAQIEPAEEPGYIMWVPWSFIYMKHVPRYLNEACYKNYAQRLVSPLGVDDLETLRSRLAERAHKLVRFWNGMFLHYPLERFDFNTIGSL